ncbi:unnamed protein product [Protopolystoma xenopodis]|uniref:Uncharacterized protein n=1 Tax=Protopolystoma xenopodis TaxID=117903 RepID=A0A448WP13_9PLAT|nr:unnamed protein product [Protopolystoma xenopodis]
MSSSRCCSDGRKPSPVSLETREDVSSSTRIHRRLVVRLAYESVHHTMHTHTHSHNATSRGSSRPNHSTNRTFCSSCLSQMMSITERQAKLRHDESTLLDGTPSRRIGTSQQS